MSAPNTTPKPSLPELRTRTTGEILDASIKVWGSNISRVATVTALMTSPFLFAGALVLKLTKPTIIDEVQRVRDLRAEGSAASLHITTRMALGTLSDFGLSTFATMFAIAAMTVLVSSLYASVRSSIVVDMDAKLVVAAVSRRSHVIIATHLAAMFIATLVGLAITVPIGVVGEFAGVPAIRFSAGFVGVSGVWVTYVLLHSGLPATITEGSGVLSTLKRSVRLSKKHRREVVAAALVLSIVTAIPNALITEMIRSILSGLGGNNSAFDVVWVGAARTVATAFCLPVAAIGYVYLYVSLRAHAGETIESSPV